MAQTTMSDAEMKKLIVGTWKNDNDRTETLTSDGRWLRTDPKFPNEPADEGYGWDVKDGELIEIRPSAGDRPFTILFLTAHEFLAQQVGHGQGYVFWWR